MFRSYLYINQSLVSLSYTRRVFSSQSLKMIDFSPFLEDANSEVLEQRNEVSQILMEQCQQIGAFQVKPFSNQYSHMDNILTEKLRDDALKSSKLYFRMSESEKRECLMINKLYNETGQEEDKGQSMIKNNGFIRGLVEYGAESGSVNLFEAKEAFSYGYELNELKNRKLNSIYDLESMDDENIKYNNSLEGGNLWPKYVHGMDPIEFRNVMCNFFDAMTNTAHILLRAFSLGLGYDNENELLDSFAREGERISLMRAFHYYPLINNNENNNTNPNKQDLIGSSEHTDWGFLTLILQEHGIQGLQFLHPEKNEWIDVENSEPGSLVINCGDFFNLMTNNRLKSPIHRVIYPKQERHSFVFFYYPNYETKLDALVSDSSTLKNADDLDYNTFTFSEKLDNLNKHENIVFGDWLNEKWDEVYRVD